jgi:hypothetical protein
VYIVIAFILLGLKLVNDNTEWATMLKRFLLLAGLLAGMSAIACSDRSADIVAPFRQHSVASGDSIFMGYGDGQVGRADTRLAGGLQVVVRNAGVPVANARGTFTVTAGGGTVSRTAFRTNSSGVALFAWTLGASGTQQVTATLTGGNSVVFNATVIPAGSTLSILVGNGQTAVPGDTLAGNLIVELRDPLGTPIPGATIRYTTLDSHGGAAKFATRTTNTAGRAVNRWMLGWGAAAQTLKASIPGVDTVVFNATTSTAGITFEIVSGNGQTGNPGTALPSVLLFALKKNGLPVEGVRGTFQISSGGGSINRNAFTTNALGRGAVTWTPGTTAPNQQLTASVGAVGTASASATANQGTFITNTSRSKELIMSRHNTLERQFTVSYRVSSTVHIMGVYVFVTNNGSRTVPGVTPQNVYCSGRYNIGAGIHDETCTITVPHGTDAGSYELEFTAGADTVILSDTMGISVDDTNPLTLDGFTLSHTTVHQNDPSTHLVRATMSGTSSQGMEMLVANIYQTDGIFLANGCNAYQAPEGTLTSVERSCDLGFNKNPGTYSIRYSAYDHAGNVVHYHVVGAVTVVP